MNATTIEHESNVATLEPGARAHDIESPAPTLVPLAPAQTAPPRDGEARTEATQVIAVFCFEEPDNAVGSFVGKTVAELAQRGMNVHMFTRRPFAVERPGVGVHLVGESLGDDLLDAVQEFTRRAANAFLKIFPVGTKGVTLLGHEWSSIPTLSLLHAIKNLEATLSLQSLEWQRSDMSSEMSWRIAEIEMTGLREARTILVHDPATAKLARRKVPSCADRIKPAHEGLPVFAPAS
jgi:hypothetical protein